MSSLFNLRLFHQMFSGWNRKANDLDCQVARHAFKLADSQCRAGEVCHNNGWFDQNGNKLGWGDLTVRDLLRIAENVHAFDTFIITGESAHCAVDGVTNLITQDVSTHRSLDQAKPCDRAYVVQHARFAILSDRIYSIYDGDDYPGERSLNEKGDCYSVTARIWPMKREKLGQLLEEQVIREAQYIDRRRDDLLKYLRQGIMSAETVAKELGDLMA